MKGTVLILLQVFGIILYQYSHAQQTPPEIEWQKSFGGSNEDIANSIQQTRDGGYIVAGRSRSIDGNVIGHHGGNDSSDYWVVKLNNTGAITWQKSLGGSRDDAGSSIQQTTDGGYIVAGNSYSNNGDVTGNHSYIDYWIVKLNDTGAIKWQKSLGGSRGDAANCIQQTKDGGYIVAGLSRSVDGDVTGHHGSSSYPDCWIVKLNDTGAIEWQKSLGGSSNDYAESIRQTDDGGYIMVGWSKSTDGDVIGHHGTSDSTDCWVVKLNDKGAIEWQRSLGGSGNDGGACIELTNDKGYIVAGWSGSISGDVTRNHGGDDYWIIKLTGVGNIEWQKSVGGSKEEFAQYIQQTKDGEYILAGYSHSVDGDVTGHHGTSDSADYWIVKLNNVGNILWQKSLGGNKWDGARSILQAKDGGYIIAGSSNSSDGDVKKNHGDYDYWIVKLAPDKRRK